VGNALALSKRSVMCVTRYRMRNVSMTSNAVSYFATGRPTRAGLGKGPAQAQRGASPVAKKSILDDKRSATACHLRFLDLELAVSRGVGASASILRLRATLRAGARSLTPRLFGAQAAQHEGRERGDQGRLKGSMGRRGNPYNNAQAESFMKTLKVEEVYLMEYETFEDVAAYNAKRHHSALGCKSPAKFEEEHARQVAI
jgi:Integrase core domain